MIIFVGGSYAGMKFKKKIAIKNVTMSWFHEPFFADIVAALFTYTYMNIARCNLPLIYKGTYLLSNFAYVQR